MTLTIALLIVSLLWLSMGSVVHKLQRMYLTEPLVALLAGVIAGPVLMILEIPKEHEHLLLEWGAKLTISMALMAAALKLKHRYLVEHTQMLSVLVVGGMLLMFGFSTLLSHYLLGLDWFASILIGAIITPTDPVIAATMISGKYADKYLNNNIKSSLIFESGINDGLAFPLVAIGWMLLNKGHMEWGEWLTKRVVYENVLASLIGAALGFGVGFIMHKAHKAGWMSQKTLLSFSIGLGFLALTLLELLHMNGIIGVFFAGLLFNRKFKKIEDLEEERIQDAIERLFTIPVFFLLGLVLPWQEWRSIGWPLLLFVLGVLVFRRVPALILLKPALKQISRWPRVLLIGWFGPIGVAALFYAVLTIKETGDERAYPLAAAVITASVLLHGLTSLPVSRLYHQHDTDDVEGDSEEDNNEEE
ncbi:cation:proton antiporter [Cesiribacter andamanensis]|uniref:Potassium/proton antiporter n=1 Tax=Cesiribacter andamanensis AMV16 TaxID=1279009 RepID=M7N0I2_9BACT|nr:cation:proton antiporter [Cesiribacter andamanensis]EMR02203.1 potassium/proton antiporter [Cesiribacter andamanensis AMV16]